MLENLQQTARNYESVYSDRRVFLKYPADWVIRFHNMCLKNELPKNARILDFGGGSGNNSLFFAQQGYNVQMTDITPTVVPLVEELFSNSGLPAPSVEILEQTPSSIPFGDSEFDFCLSNQVLYYLPNQSEIEKVTNEIYRTLKNNGLFFCTMMSRENYSISHHSKLMKDDVFTVEMPSDHRLSGTSGYKEHIFVPRDEDHLTSLFPAFEPVTIGYFDQRMFDMHSNKHWIFVGRKK